MAPSVLSPNFSERIRAATERARLPGSCPTASRLAATLLALLLVLALGLVAPPHPQLDSHVDCGAAATLQTRSNLHPQRTPCFTSARRAEMERMVWVACQRWVPMAPIRHAGPLFVGVIDEKSYKTDPNFKHLVAHLGAHLVPMVLPRWEGHGVGMYAVLQLVKALKYEGVVIKIDVMDAYPIKTLAEIVASPLPPGNIFLGTERNARIQDHLRRAGPRHKNPIFMNKNQAQPGCEQVFARNVNGGTYGGRRSELEKYLTAILTEAARPAFKANWWDPMWCDTMWCHLGVIRPRWLSDDQDAVGWWLTQRNSSAYFGDVQLDIKAVVAYTCACDLTSDLTSDSSRGNVLWRGQTVDPWFLHGAGKSGDRVCKQLAQNVRVARGILAEG